MKIGDVILYRDTHWWVVSHNRELRTFQLIRPDGTKLDLASTDPEARVLYNPPESWPFVANPMRHPKAGPVIRVLHREQDLLPLIDWVPSDFNRPGGSIFFNPALQLGRGDVLVAIHRDNSRSRISITRGFASVRTRRRRTAKPKGPTNNFNRLLDDKDWFDE